jgi:hypothetical protein
MVDVNTWDGVMLGTQWTVSIVGENDPMPKDQRSVAQVDTTKE